MSAPDSASIRLMREDDLGRVLEWRNDPSVREHMLQPHEIGRDEHRCWYEAASRDASRGLLVVEEGSQGIGFVQFTGLGADAAASWGFYVAPGAPRGSGRKLGRLALAYAFETLGLRKVCGEVIASNAASIGFHKSMGFQQEGLLREQYKVGASYVDVICFGLLRREWLAAVGN